MIEELEFVKELKKKTLEEIINKFGTGIGQLTNMKLSIWDVRDILYSEAKKIAKREAKREFDEELKEW